MNCSATNITLNNNYYRINTTLSLNEWWVSPYEKRTYETLSNRITVGWLAKWLLLLQNRMKKKKQFRIENNGKRIQSNITVHWIKHQRWLKILFGSVSYLMIIIYFVVVEVKSYHYYYYYYWISRFKFVCNYFQFTKVFLNNWFKAYTSTKPVAWALGCRPQKYIIIHE